MSGEDLARRAVACPGFRWMPGMRTKVPDAFDGMVGPWLRVLEDGVDYGPYGAPEGGLPDLDDPATLGCLLALVREAHDSPTYSSAHDYMGGGWIAFNPTVFTAFAEGPVIYPTEAEALVAALEAAP